MQFGLCEPKGTDVLFGQSGLTVQHSQNHGSDRRENCHNPQRFICSHESQHCEKQTERLCRDRARERKFFSLRITTVKGFTCVLDIFKH